MPSLTPGLHRYAIALGSNRSHGRHGPPVRILKAALAALTANGIVVEAAARVRQTAPLGPSRRRYANGAAIVTTTFSPPELLARLKAIERAFGRRRGRRWGARVLDLDILLWSGGAWRSPALAIPHPALTTRGFVLDPLAQIAPGWRTPRGPTVRHLRTRLRKAKLGCAVPRRQGSRASAQTL